MRTIKKFERPYANVQHIKLTQNSQILRISQSVRPDFFYLWIAIPDGEKYNTWYKIGLYGAEGTVDDDTVDYVDTLVGPLGPVYHLFYSIDND